MSESSSEDICTYTYANGTKRRLRVQRLNVIRRGADDVAPVTQFGHPLVEDAETGEKLIWIDSETVRDDEGNNLRIQSE